MKKLTLALAALSMVAVPSITSAHSYVTKHNHQSSVRDCRLFTNCFANSVHVHVQTTHVHRHAPVRYVRSKTALHVNWCASRYRSYRVSDNTFQPYHGSRRNCNSPYSY